MNPAAARHFPGIRYGLIGGVCVVILSLIGMVEAFNQREIVTDVITMGQTLLLLVAAFLIIRYRNLTRGVLTMIPVRRVISLSERWNSTMCG